MAKHVFVISILVSLSLITNCTFSQQTNFAEDYSPYLPELRAFNRQLDLTRIEPDSFPKTQLKPSIKYIQRPSGSIALRIFKPDTIRAIVLDIHGGAWIGGTASMYDSVNDETARICKVAVVSVDYRLAPQNPFPICVDDCKAAAKWLVNNAMKEFGTDKLIISGGSSGGQLAAVTTLYIRDSLNAINKVKGVNLLYGCFDLSRTPSARHSTDSTLILSKANLESVWDLVFHGWSMEQLQNPHYSPLYADLKNLPPALFTVGTADPLIDDTYFMEARWRLAGNKTFLAVYPESPHAFNGFPTKMAKIANERIRRWIVEASKN